jgi:hypothetical protein
MTKSHDPLRQESFQLAILEDNAHWWRPGALQESLELFERH